jgi:hypothetical protein
LPHAQQALVKSFERTMRRSARIVAAAQMAPDLEFVEDPETHIQRTVAPEGLTKRQVRIAEHALLPAKSAPLYLVEAYRDYELAQKLAAAAKDGGVSQVARAVVLVVEKPVYERVELHRDDAIEVEGKPTNG